MNSFALKITNLCCIGIFLVSSQSEQLIASSTGSITMEQIYSSSEFVVKRPVWIWDREEDCCVKSVKSSTCDGQDVVYETPEGETQVIIQANELRPRQDPSNPNTIPENARPINIESFSFSKDHNTLLIFTNSRRVWRKNTRGDYWVLNRSQNIFRKLGGNNAEESTLQFAKLSPDGSRVAYVCQNNLYLEDVISGEIYPLTQDGNDDIINGTFDWVYEEEFECRDGFRWSPDGKHIAFWRLDSSREPFFYMVDNVGLSSNTNLRRIENDENIFPQEVRAHSRYPSVLSYKYPRVGCAIASVKIGIITLPTSDETNWKIENNTRFVNFNRDEDYYIPYMEWIDGAIGLVFQALPRSQRSCELYSVDVETMEYELLCKEVDPDGAWQTLYPIFPLKDGNRFLRLSEKEGWRRIYLTSASDITTELPLTPADADVIDFVAFDYDSEGNERGIYYYASPDNATRRHLYWASLTGNNERVALKSPLDADQRLEFEDWSISPNSKWAVCTRSSFGVPPSTELIQLDGSQASSYKVLEDNAELRKRLEDTQFGSAKFLRLRIDENVNIENGNSNDDNSLMVDGWVMLPSDWEPSSSQKYPLIVYVYGEPAAQTVLDSWGGSTYLFHRALAQRGCVVVSFDGRGTPAPKGRKWRKSVYLKLGILGINDQMQALKSFLQHTSYKDKIDLDRVGVWGWSGGGTSTLNLLFNYPDLYKYGISVAPVPDYRNYDSIYQERYSGLIQEAPESYEQGSPITHAANLQGKLLLIHGTGDDNCHYQTSEELIDVLIKNGKDFESFVYPYRSHGIYEGAGTSLHLRKKMLRFWEENLLK
ncbi:MAG: DPP IV N-terminal domain-containing protein [Thermoguttaceae bacterium]